MKALEWGAPWGVALLMLVHGPARAADSPFVAIFIEKTTEARLGPFPYDRSRLAEAVRRIREAGARGVILKFFLDQAKPGNGDDELARELATLPALLQARLDPEEPASNPFPEKFHLDRITGTPEHVPSGHQGWLPLPKFSAAAAGIGFVDIRDASEPLRVPAFESYRGKPVASLVVASVELASGQRAHITAGESLRFGQASVTLTRMNEFETRLPARDSIQPIAFVNLLEKKVLPSSLKGKIVVLGYEGEKAKSFSTPRGRLSAHRLFMHSVLSLWNSIQ